LSQVDPNFARSWPQILLGRAPEFFDRNYKTEHTPIMLQSLTAIGQQSSEISR